MTTATEAAFEAASTELKEALASWRRVTRNSTNRAERLARLQAARATHEAAADACRAEQEALQTSHAKAEREAALAPRRAAKAAAAAAQGNLEFDTFDDKPDRVRVEAHGVRGMQSTPWRRTFPSWAAFEAWAEKNSENITIHATREAE
jgi:hypothetical protein